ncbi:MAG: hypothetical protein GY906_04815 [bacterium]|nr:hypothetical protein [bacterium]
MLNEKSSCFLDALQLALGCPSNMVAERYKELAPTGDVIENGYHPSIVNMVVLEKFGVGIVEIDISPSAWGTDGKSAPHPDADRISQIVTGWFKRPDFSCVVTGPRNDTGEEHANAFVGGRFLDPSQGGYALDAPNIGLRSVWCLTVPKLREDGADDVS